MKITSLESAPFHELPFLNAAPRNRGPVTERLPFLRGRVDRLPRGLEALVVASDLQGREYPLPGASNRLVGEALAEELLLLAEAGQLPAPDRTGVLLAGDLYSVPDLKKRGGWGDVRSVWRAFEGAFRWVAGVAGNHDGFGGLAAEQPQAMRTFRNKSEAHLLDGHAVELDGLRVGGVGGIVGDPKKPQRKWEDPFVASVVDLTTGGLDVLILHEPPAVPERKLRGHPAVREALDAFAHDLLVVCGHAYWREPLVDLDPTVQALNLEGRVVVLKQE